MSIETTPDAQPSNSASLARADERLRLDLLPFHAAGNDLLLILGLFYLLRLTSIPNSITEAVVPAATQTEHALALDIVHLIPVVALAVALTVYRKLPPAALGLASAPSARDICAALGAGFGAWAASAALCWCWFAVSRIAPGSSAGQPPIGEPDREYFSVMPPGAAIAFIVIGAIAEELLFRSLLLTRLRVLCGNWLIAVAASAIVFAIAHDAATIPGAIQVVLGGLVLGGLFVATGSLPAVVLAHVIYNLAWYFLWTSGGRH